MFHLNLYNMLTNEQIADALLSDIPAYKEFIKELLSAHLSKTKQTRTYWNAWFSGATGKQLEDADRPQKTTSTAQCVTEIRFDNGECISVYRTPEGGLLGIDGSVVERTEDDDVFTSIYSDDVDFVLREDKQENLGICEDTHGTRFGKIVEVADDNFPFGKLWNVPAHHLSNANNIIIAAYQVGYKDANDKSSSAQITERILEKWGILPVNPVRIHMDHADIHIK